MMPPIHFTSMYNIDMSCNNMVPTSLKDVAYGSFLNIMKKSADS